MRFSSLIRILLAGSGAVSIAAPAAVVVTFPEAGRYSDAGDPWTANRNIAELKRHLERLGERHLSPSRSLKIEVLDIDLAGRMRFHAPRTCRNQSAERPRGLAEHTTSLHPGVRREDFRRPGGDGCRYGLPLETRTGHFKRVAVLRKANARRLVPRAFYRAPPPCRGQGASP